MSLEHYTVALPSDVVDKLDALAKIEGVSRGELMERILTEAAGRAEMAGIIAAPPAARDEEPHDPPPKG